VAEIMSSPVFCVSAATLLADVLTAMVGSGLRHVVVVDNTDRCLGIVGDRALAAAWATDPTALSRTSAARLLDGQPTLVRPDATVGDVARAMRTDQVDAVGVVDSIGTPLGIVTGADLVALIAGAAVAGDESDGPDSQQPGSDQSDSDQSDSDQSD
jgi:CBS domain-containing protein